MLRKRPYIKEEWCERALKDYVKKQKQADGRIRYWIYIEELNRYLRIITLDDGVAVHNAFPDRGFEE